MQSSRWSFAVLIDMAHRKENIILLMLQKLNKAKNSMQLCFMGKKSTILKAEGTDLSDF